MKISNDIVDEKVKTNKHEDKPKTLSDSKSALEKLREKLAGSSEHADTAKAAILEPVVEPESVVVPEPVVEPEQVVVPEPVIEPEQVVVPEPVVEPEVRELTAAEKLRQRLNQINGVTAPKEDVEFVDVDEPIVESAPVEEPVVEHFEDKVVSVPDVEETQEINMNELTAQVMDSLPEVTPESDFSETVVPMEQLSVEEATYTDPIRKVETSHPMFGEDNVMLVSDAKKSGSWFADNKPIWIGAIGACVAVVLGVALATSLGGESKSKTDSTLKTEQTSTTESTEVVEKTYLEKLEEKLTEAAEKTKLPYKISINDIGGGYLLGQVVYYPGDEAKTYTDYSLTTPETKVNQSDDAKVAEIQKYLSSTMPTINDTITVKDAEKVAMETYQKEDGSFVTVLLYDGKPFAYVTTDADMSYVNYVTTYYVSDVAADVD